MLYAQFIAGFLPKLKQVTQGVGEYAVEVEEDERHDWRLLYLLLAILLVNRQLN